MNNSATPTNTPTTTDVWSYEAGDMVRIDLADSNTWFEDFSVDALRTEAGAAGDFDLIAILDTLRL